MASWLEDQGREVSGEYGAMAGAGDDRGAARERHLE